MSSFSEQLRNEAQPIWRRIFGHPFLKEIKDGTLPEETFRYYLIQDYLFLEGFGRTVTMALAKPESTEGGRRVSVLKRQEGAPVLLG